MLCLELAIDDVHCNHSSLVHSVLRSGAQVQCATWLLDGRLHGQGGSAPTVEPQAPAAPAVCYINAMAHLLKHVACRCYLHRVSDNVDGSALALQLDEANILHAGDPATPTWRRAANALHLVGRRGCSLWMTKWCLRQSSCCTLGLRSCMGQWAIEYASPRQQCCGSHSPA